MWHAHYNLNPHAYFTFSYSIIGNLDMSHITHMSYHHPTYMGESWINKKNQIFVSLQDI